MTVPYTFATATSSIPLSQLDSNFATAITLGNTAVYLGNTTTSIGNLTLTNTTISSVAVTFPNSYLSNSSVTIGTTSLSLGGTASTLANVTLSNVTISSVSTALTVPQGGTGLTTLTAGYIPYGNGTSAFSSSANMTFNGTTLTLANDASISGLTVGKGGGAIASNAAFGAYALYSNTSGGNNTAIGQYSSQNNTTGDSNTALGLSTLNANTTGNSNTAIGRQALAQNTTASNNTAVGYQAGYTNATGARNTFIGYLAGYTSAVVSANAYNTFVGAGAGQYTTTGAQNTFIGDTAGQYTTGGFNTFVGQSSGFAITSGTKNSILGMFPGNQGGLDIRTASNYIVLSDGDGNPRQVIDSSGNVGIGTSSPSSFGKLAVAGNILTIVDNSFIGLNDGGGQTSLALVKKSGGYPCVASASGTPILFSQSSASSIVSASAETYTERMRIDSSGNVGIGTSSPSAKLNVFGGSLPTSGSGYSLGISSALGATRLTTDASSRTNFIGSYYDDTAIEISQGVTSGYVSGIVIGARSATNSTVSNAIALYTQSAERMRIDSSGNLGVGTSNTTSLTNTNSYILGVSASGAVLTTQHANGTASGVGFAQYAYNSSIIGSITQTGTTAVLYNTTSDYRLKTDVLPIQNALATVEALNPVSFTWIDGRKDDGFLAHELQAVIPNCVTGEKDAVNKDGTPKYQQMDNSGVIPFLVKAIQEQQALITNLTTRLTALENK